MKNINIWLTDREHRDLTRIKDGKKQTWREFILELIKLEKQELTKEEQYLLEQAKERMKKYDKINKIEK